MPSPVAGAGRVPGARGFHASHAALFDFCQKSELLIYNTFMPSCNCPSLRSQQGAITGLIHRGKIDIYLSIQMQIYVYMYRTVASNPTGPGAEGKGTVSSSSRVVLGFLSKRALSKERAGCALPARHSLLFVSRRELSKGSAPFGCANSQLFIYLCPFRLMDLGIRPSSPLGGVPAAGEDVSPSLCPPLSGLGSQSESE